MWPGGAMAPLSDIALIALGKRQQDSTPQVSTRTSSPTRSSLTVEGGFLEAWAQGYHVGSLVILVLIVFCNYRPGVWLHKLILLELVLAVWHGTFIFVDDPIYGYYLSTTAVLLFVSYFLHNVISWIKLRRFLPPWGSRLFIISLLCVQPFWVVEAWSNFTYFNSLGSDLNVKIRPWEALMRDPWWIYTTWKLISAITNGYGFKLWTLIRMNARFGIMLLCMLLSVIFLLTDVVISATHVSTASGINPYWRFALVFKCASDTIFLDDFKSVLDDIVARKFSSLNKTQRRGSGTGPGVGSRRRSQDADRGEELVECSPMEHPFEKAAHSHTSTQLPSPKGKFLFPLSKKKKSEVPKIDTQQDTTDPSKDRQPSKDSWASDNPVLPSRAHTVYGNGDPRANESEGNLIIGRIV